MKTFFFQTLLHGEPDGKKIPVLPFKTAEKFLTLAQSSLGAMLFISVAINASAQQTDTSIFINVSAHPDTVMHIVWDKIPGGEIYMVEKSEDGNSFSPLAKIRAGALVDIMKQQQSAVNEFGNILYSTEGEHERFIYNDIQQPEKNLQYRIRINKANGAFTYTRAAYYAGSNNNSDTLGLHDFMQDLLTSSRSFCPPIGVPPSGPCVQPTNIYNTQYLNCCVVTLRRYDLMNCGVNFPCTDCVCACSCTTDPCCIHMCYQYFSCACIPWDPCGTNPQPQWVVVSTAPGLQLTVSAANFQICTGQSATLTASGASTYTWSPSSTLSASTGPSVTATPASTTTYTVIGDLNGCTDSTQVTVVVNPFPVVLVSPDDTICFGQNTILTAIGASLYSWSPSSTLYSSTGSSVIAAPLSTTTYTVIGNLSGCTASAQTTITVNPLPAVTVSPNNIICAGQSAQLTSTGASAYWWSPSSTLSSSTGPSVTASPLSTTTYTVTGNLNGCTASAQAIVTVNPLPAVTVSPDTICVGQSTQLISYGASTYTWSPSSTLSSSTGSSVTASPLSTTTYTIIGSLNGCTGSAQTTVTVNPLPIVTVSPDDTICAGQSAQIISSGANTYAWSPSSTLSSSTGSSVTASPLTTTIYTVTGDLNGCTASAQTVVTVNPLPAVTVSPNAAICIGQSAQMTSAGASTYVWGPSLTLSSSTGSSVTAMPPSTTTYTVTGNLNGCTASAQITITVNPFPVVTVSPDDTICAGQFAQLISSGANTYAWSPSSTLSSSTGSSVIASPLSTITYTLTGDLNGCTASAQTTITVNPLPVLVVSPNATICDGQSIQLTSSGANTYAWSPSSTLNSSTGSSVIASPSSTTIYTVTGDLNGCTATAQATVAVSPLPAVTVSPNAVICVGQSAQLISSGAGTYAWSPSSTLNSSTGSSVTASPLSTTTYTVTGDLNGCTASAQTTITVNPLPVLTVSPNNTICNGQSVQLISSGANTYVWSPSSTLSSSTGSTVIASPSAITTYTATGDLNGCTASAQTTVIVNPIPVVIVSPNDTICNGQSALLTAGGASSYLWSPSSALNSSAGANVIATPSATITYTVTGNQAGCTATAQVTVWVNPLPGVTFTLNPASGCSPLHVQFADGSITLPGSSYSWSFGDNSVSALQNPDHTFVQPGTFTTSLTVSSPAGCAGAATSPVTVYPNPVADFTVSPSTAEKGTEIYFTDQSYSNIVSWSWDFGDGKGTSNVQNPVYIYDSPGSFTTKLIVSNVYACVDTASSTAIITDGEFEVWIPNVFTPNSDHRNDIFNAKGMWIAKLDMTIFDRWGMEIFHTADKDEGWNGRMNGGGTDCLMDTYVYLIKAWDDKNAARQFIGHITLLR